MQGICSEAGVVMRVLMQLFDVFGNGYELQSFALVVAPFQAVVAQAVFAVIEQRQLFEQCGTRYAQAQLRQLLHGGVKVVDSGSQAQSQVEVLLVPAQVGKGLGLLETPVVAFKPVLEHIAVA